jgi:Spy/CpxP family protein refolding chaperone
MVKKLLVAGLLCASLALAQGGGGGGGKKGNSGVGNMGPSGPPASSKFDLIANALNLSKDQRKTVRTILDDGAKEAAPLRDQLSKSRIVVGEAIGANKSVDELKQVARASSDLAAQLTELELKTFAKIFGALDDTQKKDMQGLGHVLFLMNDIFHTKNWNGD